jgi:non-specific serine/threonine protein kinase
MSIPPTGFLVPLLTPHGHLRLAADHEAPPLPAASGKRLGNAFARGSGHGLLHLGAGEVGIVMPPVWAWWRDFAARYVTALCGTSEGSFVAPPNHQTLDALIADAPPMTGVEYLTTDVRGRVSRFSLDALVNIATATGRRVHMELELV